jgi:N-acetylglucosaminyl-diphospho-decaprenol L-rhamnosyltransferase
VASQFHAELIQRVPMDLSIIIVNWKSKDFLRDCLNSIDLREWSVSYEIIVIDAGSFDGSGEMLRTQFPEVHFIQRTDNLGFAKANNAAFREANGRYLLFLNPDTKVVRTAIQDMYATLQARPDAGVLGCKLLNADGSLQTSCVQAIPTILNQLLDSDFLRARWPKSSLWGTAPLYQEGSEPVEVEAISGACVMLSRAVFEQVGLFAEDYFMYAEDIDLSDKSRRAGFKNYYLPCAEVFHFGGSSSNQAPSNFAVVMMRDSIWKFLRKTRGVLYALFYRVTTLLGAAGRLGFLKFSALFGGGGRVNSAITKWEAILAWGINPNGSVASMRRGG